MKTYTVRCETDSCANTVKVLRLSPPTEKTRGLCSACEEDTADGECDVDEDWADEDAAR